MDTSYINIDNLKKNFIIGCNASKAHNAYLKLAVKKESFQFSFPLYDKNLHGTGKIGCSIKPFIAVIICNLIHSNKLSLEDRIFDKLNFKKADNFDPCLTEITVKEVLLHIDGLNDELVPKKLPTRKQFLDDLEIINTIVKASNFNLGKTGVFTYGRSGYILLGILIEKIYSMPLGEVLKSYHIILDNDVYKYFDSTINDFGNMNICPASGGDCNISLDDMFNFTKLLLRMHDCKKKPLSLILSECVNIEFNSYLFKGAYFGLKSLGHGWIGHYGMTNTHANIFAYNYQLDTCLTIIAKFEKNNGSFQNILRYSFSNCFPTLSVPVAFNFDLNITINKLLPFKGAYRYYRKIFEMSIIGESLYLVISDHINGQKQILHETKVYLSTEGKGILAVPYGYTYFIEIVFNEKYLWDGYKLWMKVDG